LDVTLQSDPVIGENIYNRGIGNMPLVWIGPPDADVSAPRSIAHLVEAPLITMTRGSQPHLALLEACRHADVHHHTLHYVGSIAAIVRLVRAGLGIAVMPRAPVRTELEDGLLRLIPCAEPLCPLPLVVSYAADPTSDAGRIVADMAAREARRYAERYGPEIANPGPD
jgi:DNA-binding transcriptional LysR family regulator